MRHAYLTVLGLAAISCSAWGQGAPGGGGAGSQGPGAGGGAGIGGGLSQRAAPLNPTQRDRMGEDIEVMRRLLEGELRSIYGYPPATLVDSGTGAHDHAALNAWITNVAPQDRVNVKDMWHDLGRPAAGANRNFNPVFTDLSSSILAHQHKDPHAQVLLPSAEGSYLPGYGVVYTMTLPPPSKETKPEPPKPVKKPLSAWERARKELRGEPLELEPPAEQRPPSVSGTILKVLAENGQYFSHLKDNEQLTVAITFRSKWGSNMAQCSACHVDPHSGIGGTGSAGGAGAGMAGAGGAVGGVSGGAAGLGGGGAGGGAPGAGSGAVGAGGQGAGGGAGGLNLGGSAGGAAWGIGLGGGGGSGPAPNKPWEDRMLLGDLHLKNGRVKDALGEYAKAAQVLDDYMGKTWNWDRQQLKSAEELYGKLIQAHIVNGDRAAARAVLDKFEKIPPLNPAVAAQAPAKPKTETPKPVALPGKLIISAPKRLLDQVAGGKITMEEFRKAAIVE